MACNEECAFFTSDVYNNHNLWSCQKVCDALVYLLDNIFIRFGTKLYRQTIGIPMETNCAPLVADLFRFCYERDFPPKFMINGTILILISSISLFWMAMSPGVPHMEYTYLNL